MGLWSKVKDENTQFSGPQTIGTVMMIVLRNIQNMLVNGIETWAPRLPMKGAVVDFSSPNIAKEMHVGHFEVDYYWRYHCLHVGIFKCGGASDVGDWGTQFGMLIEYLFEKFPTGEVASDQAIEDLQVFYKESKNRFDSDPAFKERAQQAVVSLQAGVEKYRRAWAEICQINRNGFEQVYQWLGVHLEENGESFYNPYIPGALELLSKHGLIEESQGACVIFIEGKRIPLIVVKSDGGYNYASTDLTALWYRLNEEMAEWIIYVTDVGQSEHFEMFFTAAKRAGWLPAEDDKYPKTSPVGFGLVLGDDRKQFRTRCTETVKLVDLLDEAKLRCKAGLIERGKDQIFTEVELDKTAEAVRYGASLYI